MEIVNINAFFDLCVVTDKHETFGELDTQSSKGLIVLFDSSTMSASKAEQLSTNLWNKLIAESSPRVNALDFTSTYAGKDKPCVPIAVAKNHIINQYQELAVEVVSNIQQQVDANPVAPNVMANPHGN